MSATDDELKRIIEDNGTLLYPSVELMSQIQFQVSLEGRRITNKQRGTEDAILGGKTAMRRFLDNENKRAKQHLDLMKQIRLRDQTGGLISGEN